MSASLQRVLVIGAVWPEPQATAAGSYIVQLLQALRAHGCDVVFACSARRGALATPLASLGVREETIALNSSDFDAWVAALQPDAVLFDRFMTEEQFGWRVETHCPQAIRVLVTQDLHCLREARQQHLQDALRHTPQLETLPATLHVDAMTDAVCASDLAVRELSALYRCDLSLLVSPVERDWLVQRLGVPASLLCVCPLLYDVAAAAHHNHQHGLPFAERAGFVSIGNFLHAPNRDAVDWLRRQVWPQIRARLPHAQCHVYGAYAPPAVLQWHNPASGFLVHGQADDAFRVLRTARVLLAPLRFGAGIKGKLAEAMLCDTPSVTTPIGAEGMADPGERWPGAVASSAAALAAAAIALHEEPATWQQAVDDGISLRQRFGRERIAPALLTALQQVLAGREAHRRANLTGRMLRYHQHRSTEFMARWIEAKNALASQRDGTA